MAEILVIDDEEGLRVTFESFLSAEGFGVKVAGSFDEAMERIKAEDFDLIFADILLEGKSGIDILREVKQVNPGSEVVMITGVPNVETASDAVRLGAFDYIPKPVKKQTLLRVTEMALKHKALNDEKEKYRANLEAIFRSVMDAIITVDNRLYLLEVNDSANAVCGISRDGIGKPFETEKCDGKCREILDDTIREKRQVKAHRIECGRRERPGQVVTVSAFSLLDHKKVFSGAVLVVKDETRIEELERDLGERKRFHTMIGKSAGMQKVYSLIEGLAGVPTTVLITGESGTGKELVAEALHYRGLRSAGPLVKVNCSALPENLLESELFGHVKGSFTGAIRDKAGRFEKADQGTIFLDEIGDLSQAMQLRLLRVLQEKEFERVGDATPIKVDVRVAAATNRDLREKVRLGAFREDLFYRLKVIEINLPPLRERREDLPLFVEHFIGKFNREFNKQIEAVSTDVMKIFMAYDWPGNVRELEHAIEHAFILCAKPVITVDDLPKELKGEITSEQSAGDSTDEHQRILRALQQTRWKKAAAARLLGISRPTLYQKLREYNIQKPE